MAFLTDAANISDYATWNDRIINGELVRIWEEAVVA
jgi:hypothetical protein